MNHAADIATNCVQFHQAYIIALAGATANRDSFSRAEVLEVIGCKHPP